MPPANPDSPIYDYRLAVRRIEAAAAAARALPFPFMLVARAENYLHGRPDLDDTIRRLQAYEAAGAEVLYAPGITQPDDIRAVCSAVKKPVNVLMGMKGAPPLSVKELGELGVRRISLGSGFSRAAPHSLSARRSRSHRRRNLHLCRRNHVHLRAHKPVARPEIKRFFADAYQGSSTT